MLKTLALVLLVFGALPALVLEYGPRTPIGAYPFVVIFGVWALVLIVLGIRKKRSGGGGALVFNLGFLCLVLAVAELVAGTSQGPAKRMVRQPSRRDYVAKHPELGYAPRQNRASRFTAMVDDETVYDVTYTVGKDGLRARPPRREPPPDGSVLLFGCSFTYGAALNDDQTIPWRLEQALDGRLRCYNFGFSGYGPHQMLANLESGRVEEIIRYAPTQAFYLAIPDHARRVVGLVAHDRHGPRYVLREDGTVERAGQFSDDKGSVWRKRIVQFLNHFHLGSRITSRLARGEGSVPLLVAVIAAGRDRIQTRWPECRFDVLLWDGAGVASDEIVRSLQARGIPVHLVSDILPGYGEDPSRFAIHAADDHPNADATAAIARYLAGEVAEPE